jgi:glycosyltransferase involved in cell wall biosynthesis
MDLTRRAKMKITVCHSHQERCGIREYGSQLDRSLISLGAHVIPCSYAYLGEVVAKIERDSIFLVHFEPGLANPWYLTQFLKAARDRGARTVLCCHWYEYEYMRQYDNFVDRYVIHRDYGPRHPQAVIIPLGCPLYTPVAPQADLRKRFDLPVEATILTTIGFLNRWKAIPDLTRSLLNAIEAYPNIHVRIHTPWPFDGQNYGSDIEEASTREVIAKHQCKRVSFSTDFLPEEQTLDLVRASDLGFIYHPFHTHSVSAATKQFVSARRPLVVTGSTHSSDLRGGVVRVGTFDAMSLARLTVATATNADALARLQIEIEREYERLNMNTVARQYMALFETLTHITPSTSANLA